MKRMTWAIAVALIAPMIGLLPPAASAPSRPGDGATPQAAGMRLLYTRWVNGAPGDQLRSVKLDGADARQHLPVSAGARGASLSPDRERLAWVTYSPDRVMVGNATAGAARKLLDGFAQTPMWSPDGTSIYTSTTDRDWMEPTRIWRVPVDGGDPVPVWEGEAGEYVALLGVSATHLLAETVGNGMPRQFTVPVDGGAPVEHPTWDAATHAPGTEIAFALEPKSGAYRLVRYDMAAGASRIVHTFKNKKVWYQTWSADGSRFAISGTDSRGPFMLLMNRSGERKVRIAKLPKLSSAGYGRIGLSPDGKAMAYQVSSRYGSPYDGLYLRDNKRARACKVKVAASSPSAVFSTDGRWIVVSEYSSAIVATKKVVSKGGGVDKVRLGGNTEVVGFIGGSATPAAIAPCGKG